MSRKSNKGVRPKNDAAAVSSPAVNASADAGRLWTILGVCLFLAAITALVFGRTAGYDFIPYDDNVYVYENPIVARGLSLKSIIWAFSHSDLYLWTPLTTISHIIDSQIYGVQHAGGHHLTNVLLHIATVVVLFLALQQMTGALWRSAFVAAVFAIHPLRVESVAWVAERKDVLCGFFFALTLLAYAGYARKRTVARYVAVAVLFALGLMSKQMVVTLPCVLLLLDYWPLKRFEQPPGGMPVFLRLVIEKLPLFALSAASCFQSFAGRTLKPGTVVPGLNQTSWLRIDNALVSYVIYIGKLFYPVNLSIFYPYPASVPAWQALGAFALLAGVSTAVFAWRGRHPEFLTGWLWYLGMLVPVIGFIPLGKEGHADRYTYLPGIGLCIMVAWAADALTASWPYRRKIMSVAAAFVLALLARLAAVQASYWSDGVTLWKHALEITPDSGMVHNFLGNSILAENKDVDGAIAEYKKAIAIMPLYSDSENDLGKALYQEGDVDDAINHYNRALELDQGNAEARGNLAVALTRKGLFDEAITQLRMLIQFKPDLPEPYNNLGNALLEKPVPDLDGAIAQFQKALDIKPDYADAHTGLGNAFLKKGEPRQAVSEYQKSLRIDPQSPFVLLTIARVLATCEDAAVRDGPKAVDYASQANDISGGDNPQFLDTLAAAFAEAGRFPDAIETSRRALELATAAGDTKLANTLQAHLELYRANSPLRVPVAKPPGR